MAQTDYISERRMSEYDVLIKQHISTEIGNIETFKQEVVSTLPLTGEPKTLYLVPVQSGSGDHYSDEYVWVEAHGTEGQSGYIPAHFEKVGSTEYTPDHSIADDTDNPGYLVLTIGNESFAIERTKLITPILTAAYNNTDIASGGDNSNSPIVTTGSTASINVSCTNVAGAVIYYTLDGTDPTTESSQFAGAMQLYIKTDSITPIDEQHPSTYTVTFKAKAFANGRGSQVFTYTFYIARKLKQPTISISNPSGSSTNGSVSIDKNNSTGTIRYTTDGTAPSSSSDAYSEAFTVNTKQEVKAAVFADSWTASEADSKSKTFDINMPSISVDSNDQDAATRTVTVNTTDSTPDITLVCKTTSDGGTTWDTVTLTNNQYTYSTAGTHKFKLEASKTNWNDGSSTSGNILVKTLKDVTVTLNSGTDAYDTTRYVTATCASASSIGYTMRYAINAQPTSSSTEVPSGGVIAVDTTGTNVVVNVKAFKDDYISSTTGTCTINQIGKKKCYIGQAASVSTASDVESLTNKYKETNGTMVGQTKIVNVTTTVETGQYAWFAMPKATAPTSLTIKVNNDTTPSTVPLLNNAGTEIGDYRVWRSEKKLFNATGSYDFNFS